MRTRIRGVGSLKSELIKKSREAALAALQIFNKPNVKWKKDRCKDVESAPWFHLFKGNRINDHHLTLAEKRAARM